MSVALESIAGLLASQPDESVEGLLVTFDALAGVSDDGLRPVAAQILRNAAESCQDATRRKRLPSAAGAVAAGQPCALTADGRRLLPLNSRCDDRRQQIRRGGVTGHVRILLAALRSEE